ncbi:toxin-antitoxin system HicB family antitoxin [Cryomorpha ignava]|uniref:Toxin-antitoxin system HicB family antitoxin n=1 Tax=Cryomorpha ignava TaxID=101383 RepID=A0A7K3WS88_9FLAO|nr:toxin-antitoxin system HicB family antitoxin [Cryomorpha ignava]NEN23722.1 toxin-antitoxin system HicB family antitoxin [Cryomorpha ignava]
MASKQMAFRFDEELIRQVKIKAEAEHRSLNNYIEVLMLRDIGKIPNAETKKAIDEVMSGKELEEIDDIDEFMDSL